LSLTCSVQAYSIQHYIIKFVIDLLGPGVLDTTLYNKVCDLKLPLMLWVRISIRARCTLCDKACQWLAAGRWFSPDPPVSSINKTDCHNITEILLKVALHYIIKFVIDLLGPGVLDTTLYNKVCHWLARSRRTRYNII
jgi:hypothetical protein